MTLILAALGALILVWLEWRRGDSRHWFARIFATLLAIIALTLFGVYRPTAAKTEPRGGDVSVGLRTAGAGTSETAPAGALWFALPEASAKPADATMIPDVAFLWRHYPEIKALHVIGDGLEPHDLDVLRGLQLSLQPGEFAPSRPAVSFLHAPRETALGERIKLHGRIAGLKPSESVTLILESPDGAKSEAVVTKNGDAEPGFEISAASPSAAGQFVWRLKLSSSAGSEPIVVDEQIGISVVPPNLPRVLILEGSPRLDTAHLQRWFAEMGGNLRSRTLVGEGRYRFSSTKNEGVEFPAIDRELLEQSDILIVDTGALAALLPAERDALQSAVTELGMGVLVTAAGENPFEQSNIGGAAFLLPWKITEQASAASSIENETRLARLHWAGLRDPLEHPVPVEPFMIEPVTGQRELVSDSQGRAVVSAVRRGRGTVAFGLTRDTWRWRLENQAATFAQYWSFLFSELSRPQASAGNWTIVNAETEPLSVNRPVELLYSGSAEPQSPASVADGEGQTARLPLAQDSVEAMKWRTTFWPRRSGWHRITTSPNGASFSFFVHDASEWSSLVSGRRRAATEQWVELARPRAIERDEMPSPLPFLKRAGGTLPALLFILFVTSSGYLWLERRRAVRG